MLAALTAFDAPAAAREVPGVVVTVDYDGWRRPWYGHDHWGRHWDDRPYYRPYYRPPIILAPLPPQVLGPPAVIYDWPPPVPVPAPPLAQGLATTNCREFQSTIVIDGKPQPAHGTACLQPDGTWRVVR